MREVNRVIRQADLRPLVRVEKIGHKAEHTLLAFGGGGGGAAAGARFCSHVICRGCWIRIDIEIGRIDCIRPGRTGWGGRHGGCSHFFAGRKSGRTKFLLRRGKWILVVEIDVREELLVLLNGLPGRFVMFDCYF